MEPPGRRTAYTPCVGSTSFARPRALIGIAVVLSTALVLGAWRFARQSAVELTANDVEAPAPQSDAASLAEFGETFVVGSGEGPRLAVEAPLVESPPESLVGVVVSAEAGTVISGAEVAAVEPMTLALEALERQLPGFLVRGLDNRVQARHRGGWPDISGLDAAELLRTDRLRVTGLALDTAREITSTRTDPDGHFELAAKAPVTLRVTAEGFATRSVAVATQRDPIRIELHALRRFSGRVRLADGAPPPSPLLLAFYGEVPGAEGPESWSGVHVSRARCAPDGSFELEAGATQLRVDVVEPGWRLEPPWAPTGVAPDVAADIVVVAEPHVRFVASETGAPLDRVFLARRHAKVGGQVGLAGEFRTRAGRLGLDFGRIPLAVQEQIYGALEYTAWAQHRASARFTAQDVLAAGELVVALGPGELARLEGIVHRRGQPIADADVRLLAFPAWIDLGGDERTIGAGLTDELGRFTFEGPPGAAQLAVRVDGAIVVRTVAELPSAGPLHIDLSALGTLTVRVERTDGTLVSRHIVFQEGANGRNTSAETDEYGLATFTNLPAGTYRVWAPTKVVMTLAGVVPTADVTAEVALLPGEEREVRLVLQPVAPVEERR
jgi:hypothetical protein